MISLAGPWRSRITYIATLTLLLYVYYIPLSNMHDKHHSLIIFFFLESSHSQIQLCSIPNHYMLHIYDEIQIEYNGHPATHDQRVDQVCTLIHRTTLQHQKEKEKRKLITRSSSEQRETSRNQRLQLLRCTSQHHQRCMRPHDRPTKTKCRKG